MKMFLFILIIFSAVLFGQVNNLDTSIVNSDTILQNLQLEYDSLQTVYKQNIKRLESINRENDRIEKRCMWLDAYFTGRYDAIKNTRTYRELKNEK